jgi:glycosidase
MASQLGPFGYPRPARHYSRSATIYQIYPASFCSSGTIDNGGLGDLKGIISKLDYIASIGVDVIWLSPILKSPMVDMGYDISDYQEIDWRYGTMSDLDELIQEAKKRGLEVVMDLVVNHTSDQHEWFQQSRRRENGKDDWYIWRKGVVRDGKEGPPNNWEAAFGGSVWTYDELRKEWYLHLFAVEQPDLNWENEEVRKSVLGMMRWWLEKGVKGFRMDVINFISKDQRFLDGEIRKEGFLQSGGEYYACGPRLHEYLQEIGALLKEFDAFSVGEMPGVHDETEIVKAVTQERGELGMAFQFEIVDIDHQPSGKWEPRKFEVKELRRIVDKWQRFMLENGGWNAIYMENHDQSRTVSRYADDSDEMRMISAKMLAAHMALQSGTIFVYQGQELGMKSMPKDWPEEKYKDIEMLNFWHQVLRDFPDDKERQKSYWDQIQLLARDNARTPMQWSAAPNAGFIPENQQPWMSIHPDFRKWNADTIVADEGSSFHYWSRLLALRKKHEDLFIYGDFDMIRDNSEVIAYVRTEDLDIESKRQAMIVTNFAKNETWWDVPQKYSGLILEGGALGKNVLPEFRNYNTSNEVRGSSVKLRPLEVLIAMSRKLQRT